VKKSAFISIILAILLLLPLVAGCSSDSEETGTTKVITDMAGVQVTIPTKIERIADAWRAHNEVLTMLGVGSKIVATSIPANACPWLHLVNPQMNNAVVCFTTDVNMEELIKSKPDIVFVSIGTKYIDTIKQAGIPVVQLNFTDFDTLKQCYKLTGDIFGGNTAKKADEYIKYLESKISDLSAVTAKVPDADKPSVMHIASVDPIQVDGNTSIIDNWIKLAGGVNAASDVKGNFQPVSIEQILKWNPDIVILMSSATAAGKIKTDSVWQQIPAIKNGKLYYNPEGAFPWDRYSAEEALQIQWTAKILYPDEFKDLDMVKETISFYKKFMNFDITTDQANLILAGLPPAK
jgi:iron complex transport system substrate-binding protein